MTYSGIKQEFEAFQNKINLNLFHEVLYLAASTSDVEDAMKKYQDVLKRTVWEEYRCEENSLLEKKGLRYVGEVLERYEDQFGPGKENLRAVALAVGYAASFLSSSMFIGSQKEDFLKKVRSNSEDDLYLQAALCLMEDSVAKHKARIDELSRITFQNTEDATFVFSLYDDASQGFSILQEKLFDLWGIHRSISLVTNIGILKWLIARCEPVIRSCRKKNNAVLRTLMKLPYQFVKLGSTEYAILHEAGYSHEEITFANSMVLWDRRIYDRISPDSIPGEKVATEFCHTWLNTEQEINDDILDYLGWILHRYEEFAIKYEGHHGIWFAMQDEINPVQPKTVLWMVQNLVKERGEMFPYNFDVYDSKWDVLAEKLEIDQYRVLFSYQFLNQKEKTKEMIQSWLEKFKELTGEEFIETFASHYNGYNEKCFHMLIEYGGIDLFAFFQNTVSSESEQREQSSCVYYLKNYIRGIHTRKAFDFVKKIFSIYSMEQFTSLLGDSYWLHNSICEHRYGGYSRDSWRLDLHRDFLTQEEEKELFNWVDESFFRMEPDRYIDFVKTVLEDKYVLQLYDKKELRDILDTLISLDKLPGYNVQALKRIYFSDEELQKEQDAREKAEREKKERDRINELNKIQKQIEEAYDGSYDSLNQQLKKFYFSGTKKDALKIIYPIVEAKIRDADVAIPPEELASFLILSGQMIKYEAVSWEKLCPMVSKVMEEGIR